jgi:hypothetical protein
MPRPPKSPLVAKPYVRGSRPLEHSYVVKKLGKQTTRIWIALMYRRDQEGKSFATARHLTRALGVPYSTVKKAIAKLTKLRIIQGGRWEKRDCPTKKYVRTIYGDHRNYAFTVTGEIEKLIAEASTRGGKRTNAGRPEGSTVQCRKPSMRLNIKGKLECGTMEKARKPNHLIKKGQPPKRTSMLDTYRNNLDLSVGKGNKSKRADLLIKKGQHKELNMFPCIAPPLGGSIKENIALLNCRSVAVYSNSYFSSNDAKCISIKNTEQRSLYRGSPLFDFDTKLDPRQPVDCDRRLEGILGVLPKIRFDAFSGIPIPKFWRNSKKRRKVSGRVFDWGSIENVKLPHLGFTTTVRWLGVNTTAQSEAINIVKTDPQNNSPTHNVPNVSDESKSRRQRRLVGVKAELPPYPSTSLIGVCKIPQPPTLKEGLSDVAMVTKLGEAYRAVFESRLGKRSYVLSRGKVKNSKSYPGLLAAAQWMQEGDVAPMAWAAFSFDCWTAFDEKKGDGPNGKPPPLNWVFSVKRLDERAGWYDREASSYGGGRLLFTDAHRNLLAQYEGLRRACYKHLLTEALVDDWFPGGWEKHYEEAKALAVADQARMNDIVRRGEFVW